MAMNKKELQNFIAQGLALEIGNNFKAEAVKRYSRVMDAQGLVFDVKNRTEYVITNEDGRLTARLQGPIDPWFGFDVDAFITELDKHAPFQSLKLIIDSPGGSVFMGLSLFHELNRLAEENNVEVEARAGAIVASAATLPFLAAKKRVMPKASMFMIHQVSGCFLFCGNKEEAKEFFDKWFNAMNTIEGILEDIYADISNLDLNAVRENMRAEKFYKPDEAMEAGFATTIDNAAQDDDDDTDPALAEEMNAKVFQSFSNATA